jgi:membrane protein DedA with SNARE-associated domain
MFYISPYFTSTLPVFDIIQENVPFTIFLLIYILAIFIGSAIIYCIAYLIKLYFNKKIKTLNTKVKIEEVKEKVKL